ncbi:MAG: hypothetical protein RLZZ210_194 [Pseudomonadota bacterium]|jgi:NAD+ synthetase
MIRFAIAQLNSHIANLEQNLIKATNSCIEAKHNNADIIIFPELFLTGYTPQDLLLECEFIKSCQEQLFKFKQQTKHLDLYIIIGHISNGSNKNTIHNSAYVIYKGEELAVYNKINLPNHGVFDEKRYFSAGYQPTIVNFKNTNVSLELAICEDIWHTKSYDDNTKHGDILISINASPFQINKHPERVEKLSQHIHKKQSAVYVNMVGGQDEIVFDGSSFILDNNNQLTTQLAKFKEQIAYHDYDENKKNWIRQDNNISLNLNIFEDIYNATVLATRDYVRKTNFKKIVLGLSGGVDSALVACIAVDALGKENVHTIMMPSEYTSDISLQDAQQLAQNLGISYEIIAISPILDAFKQSLSASFDNLPVLTNDVSFENLQARIRGNLLMAYSNRTNSLVLTTGNKSELAVGYCTLYGDMCGAFNPIKDILKTQVYKVCEYYNNINTHKIPLRILTRAPSAELRPDQTDQDSLPPYEILDKILVEHIEKYKNADEIIAGGIDAHTVKRILRLIKINEYKRNQGAIGVKISSRAFGKDWRYDISKFIG